MVNETLNDILLPIKEEKQKPIGRFDLPFSPYKEVIKSIREVPELSKTLPSEIEPPDIPFLSKRYWLEWSKNVMSDPLSLVLAGGSIIAPEITGTAFLFTMGIGALNSLTSAIKREGAVKGTVTGTKEFLMGMPLVSPVRAFLTKGWKGFKDDFRENPWATLWGIPLVHGYIKKGEVRNIVDKYKEKGINLFDVKEVKENINKIDPKDLNELKTVIKDFIEQNKKPSFENLNEGVLKTIGYELLEKRKPTITEIREFLKDLPEGEKVLRNIENKFEIKEDKIVGFKDEALKNFIVEEFEKIKEIKKEIKPEELKEPKPPEEIKEVKPVEEVKTEIPKEEIKPISEIIDLSEVKPKEVHLPSKLKKIGVNTQELRMRLNEVKVKVPEEIRMRLRDVFKMEIKPEVSFNEFSRIVTELGNKIPDLLKKDKMKGIKLRNELLWKRDNIILDFAKKFKEELKAKQIKPQPVDVRQQLKRFSKGEEVTVFFKEKPNERPKPVTGKLISKGKHTFIIETEEGIRKSIDIKDVRDVAKFIEAKELLKETEIPKEELPKEELPPELPKEDWREAFGEKPQEVKPPEVKPQIEKNPPVKEGELKEFPFKDFKIDDDIVLTLKGDPASGIPEGKIISGKYKGKTPDGKILIETREGDFAIPPKLIEEPRKPPPMDVAVENAVSNIEKKEVKEIPPEYKKIEKSLIEIYEKYEDPFIENKINEIGVKKENLRELLELKEDLQKRIEKTRAEELEAGLNEKRIKEIQERRSKLEEELNDVEQKINNIDNDIRLTSNEIQDHIKRKYGTILNREYLFSYLKSLKRLTPWGIVFLLAMAEYDNLSAGMFSDAHDKTSKGDFLKWLVPTALGLYFGRGLIKGLFKKFKDHPQFREALRTETGEPPPQIRPPQERFTGNVESPQGTFKITFWHLLKPAYHLFAIIEEKTGIPVYSKMFEPIDFAKRQASDFAYKTMKEFMPHLQKTIKAKHLKTMSQWLDGQLLTVEIGEKTVKLRDISREGIRQELRRGEEVIIEVPKEIYNDWKIIRDKWYKLAEQEDILKPIPEVIEVAGLRDDFINIIEEIRPLIGEMRQSDLIQRAKQRWEEVLKQKYGVRGFNRQSNNPYVQRATALRDIGLSVLKSRLRPYFTHMAIKDVPLVDLINENVFKTQVKRTLSEKWREEGRDFTPEELNREVNRIWEEIQRERLTTTEMLTNLISSVPVHYDPLMTFFWEMKRTGALQHYEMDFLKVLTAYVNGIAKKKFLKPVIEDVVKMINEGTGGPFQVARILTETGKAKPIQNILEIDETGRLRVNPEVYRQSIKNKQLLELTLEWIEREALGHPPPGDVILINTIESAVNKFRKLLGKKEIGEKEIRDGIYAMINVMYAGALGRPASWIKNLQQNVLSIGLLGWRWVLRGLLKAMTEEGQKAFREAKLKPPLVMERQMLAFSMLPAKSKLFRIATFLLKGFDMSDTINRMGVYLGSLEKFSHYWKLVEREGRPVEWFYNKLGVKKWRTPQFERFKSLVEEGKIAEAKDYYGKINTFDTQYIYQMGNLPPALRNVPLLGKSRLAGRIFFPFVTWPLWYISLLGKYISKGNYGALLRTVGYSFGMMALASAFGINLANWFIAGPLPETIVPLGPPVQFMNNILKASKNLATYLEAKITGQDTESHRKKLKYAIASLKRSIPYVLPYVSWYIGIKEALEEREPRKKVLKALGFPKSTIKEKGEKTPFELLLKELRGE